MSAPRFHPLLRLIIFAILTTAFAKVTTVVIRGAMDTASMLTAVPSEAIGYEFQQRYGLLLVLFYYPAVAVCLIYCRRYLDRRSVGSLGVRMGTGQTWNSFFGGAASGACAVSLLCAILWVVGGLQWQGWSPEAFADGLPMTLGMLSLYAIVFYAVGFMEEFVFRGYLLHNLYAWLGFRAALTLQAILFALAHIGNVSQGDGRFLSILANNWQCLPNLFLIAIFFGLCYRKTGSLWFPIGFHAAWNFFLGNILSTPVSGLRSFRLFDVHLSSNALLSGGAFGVEASWVLTPLILAMIYFATRLPDHPQALLDMDTLNQSAEVVTPQTPHGPEAPIIVPTPTPDHEVEDEPAPTPSRFRTSMKPREDEPSLPPEFFMQRRLPEKSFDAVTGEVGNTAAESNAATASNASDTPTANTPVVEEWTPRTGPLPEIPTTEPATSSATDPVPTTITLPATQPIPPAVTETQLTSNADEIPQIDSPPPPSPPVAPSNTPRKPPAPRW